MPFIDDLRQRYPGYSDTDLVSAYARKFSMPEEQAYQEVGIPKRGLGSDLAASFKQGVQQLPGAIAGLADVIPAAVTGTRPFTAASTAVGEAIGFTPGRWAEESQRTEMSPEWQQEQARIQASEGIVDATKAWLSSPRSLLGAVAGSLPSMAAGGVIGRAAMGLGGLASRVGATAAPYVAAGVGEGSIMAGQSLGQYDPELPNQQRAGISALGVGVVGGAVGALGGAVATRAGLADIDVALAGGKPVDLLRDLAKRPMSAPARIAGGAIAEGVLEEAPQSAVETAAQNYMTDQPLTQGMAQNVVGGALAGGLMGGMFNIRATRSRGAWRRDIAAAQQALTNPDTPPEVREQAAAFMQRVEAPYQPPGMEEGMDLVRRERQAAFDEPGAAPAAGEEEAAVMQNLQTERQQQWMAEEQARRAEPPRFDVTVVGTGPNSPLNAPYQAARDQADSLGLTSRIEDFLADRRAIGDIAATLAKPLGEAGIKGKDRVEFIKRVRTTLGVPARDTDASRIEFGWWKRDYEQRRGIGDVSGPQTPQTQPVQAQQPQAPAAPDVAAPAAPQGTQDEATLQSRLDAMETEVNALAETDIPARPKAAKIPGRAPLDEPGLQYVAHALNQGSSKEPTGPYARLFSALKSWNQAMVNLGTAKTESAQEKWHGEVQRTTRGEAGSVDAVVPLLYAMEQEFGTEGMDQLMGRLKSGWSAGTAERAGVPQVSPHIRLSAAWRAYRDGALTAREGVGAAGGRRLRGNFLEERINQYLRAQDIDVDDKLPEKIKTAGLLRYLSDASWQGFGPDLHAVSRMLHHYFSEGGKQPNIVFSEKALGTQNERGSFDDGKNELTIYKEGQNPVTFLHELLHAATQYHILYAKVSRGRDLLYNTLVTFAKLHDKQYKVFTKDLDANTVTRLNAATSNVLGAFKAANNDPGKMRVAIAEFVAYGMTNMDFQEYMKALGLEKIQSPYLLKKVPANDPRGAVMRKNSRLGIWSKFVNGLTLILTGKPFNEKNASVMTQFLSDTTWLLEEVGPVTPETGVIPGTTTESASVDTKAVKVKPAPAPAPEAAVAPKALPPRAAAAVAKATKSKAVPVAPVFDTRTQLGLGDRVRLRDGKEGLVNNIRGDQYRIKVEGEREMRSVSRENAGFVAKAGKKLFEVKAKGGAWVTEASKVLAEPLVTALPSRKAWAEQAVSQYLTEHAGTAADPLKDVKVPYGAEPARWEDLTDAIVRVASIPKLLRAMRRGDTQLGEPLWDVEGTRAGDPAWPALQALRSYLSRVGSYLVSSEEFSTSPEKFDLARAVKETAAQGTKLLEASPFAPTAGTAVNLAAQPTFDPRHARTSWFQGAANQWGYDRFASGVAGRFETLAKNYAEAFPNGAKWIRYIDYTFALPHILSEEWAHVDQMRHMPIGRANELAAVLNNLPDARQDMVVAYLDGRSTGVSLTATERLVADRFSTAFGQLLKDYRNSVYPDDKMHLEQRKAFDARVGNASLSSLLVYISDPSKTRGRSLSVTPISAWMASKTASVSKEFQVIGLDEKDAENAVFYAVMEPDLLSGGTEPLVSRFVHSRFARVGSASLGANETIDLSTEWFFKGADSQNAGNVVFARNETLADAKKKSKAASHGSAVQNTVDWMDRVVSSARYADATVSLGLANGLVYDTREALIKANPWMETAEIPTIGAARSRTYAEQSVLRRGDKWISVPENSRAYGAMAGKYINGSVWGALEDIHYSQPAINSPAFNTAIRWFKKNKTVWSPGTHIVNAGSNVAWAYLHDIPVSALSEGVQLYYKQAVHPETLTPRERALWDAFEASGALISNYASTELRELLSDAAIESFGKKPTPGIWGLTEAMTMYEKAKASRIAQLGAKWANKADDVAQELYAAEDNAFRLAAFMSKAASIEAQTGKPLDQAGLLIAGRAASTEFLDYNIHARGINMMKQTVFPFISWPYRAIPALLKIALHKPWKLGGVIGAMAVLDAMAVAMTGGSDEDERKRKKLPAYLNERLFGFGPRMYVEIPGLGNAENPVYFKLGGFVPLGDLIQGDTRNGMLGQKWWPAQLTPNGPIISTLAAVLSNRDPFTGQEISKDTDSQWDAFKKRVVFLEGQYAPPALDIKRGTERWDRVVNDKRGPLGREYNDSVELAQWVGLRFTQVNMSEAVYNQRRAVSAIEAEYRREESRIVREARRYPGADPADLREKRKALRERLLKELERVKNVGVEE